ncbi:mechanosensitive ion channel family protein [Neorhizobium lilium]|uniref:Mechanosensitive ion channel family protein n=1 Tax=Neorhizobium lilium TaxID=2503024 RepID=A0A444LDP5_9HYPH|nr:mechanosensitive ion channel family protein [Neorhizobium lilium]RWX75976.1 mechanosensitive ion channel family protein [Neorhizobium lilium]
MEKLMPFCRAAVIGLAAIFGVASPALAQDAPLTIILHQGQSASDVQQVLDLAAQTGRPVTVQVEQAKTSPAGATAVAATAPPAPIAPAPATPTPAMESTPEMAAGSMGMASWERSSDALLRGATVALAGLSGLSGMIATTAAKLEAENSSYGRAVLAGILSVAAGAGATFLVRSLLQMLVSRRMVTHRVAGTFRRAIRCLLIDLASIGFFLAASKLVLHLASEATTTAFQLGEGIVTAAFVSSVYIVVARFLFLPDRHGTPLIDIRNPHWHYRMLVSYGLISACLSESVRLAHALGLEKGSIDGWFLIGNMVLVVLKLTWFIGGRESIRDAFLGAKPGLVRRVIGNLLPEFYIATAIFIWLGGFLVAGTTDSPRWTFAAGSTQMILLIVPVLALGAHALMDEITLHWEATHGHGFWSSFLASLRVVLAGAAWIIGLHLITRIWWPLMQGEAVLATGWIIWLERFSLAIAASWAVYTFVWKYAESIAPQQQVMLPGQEDEQAEKKPTSRLSTALPVIRNLVLGAVLAVGGLIILSSLGLNVAPLLAGFGVLGLALSFGSQALVKDVVSGIFFIVDDAFRIGEYINTGKLQGTVEQITVRSVRLRHHNGPIHTIPFGQITSVSNFSRDWGTIKFQLRFERDSDAEVIRKAAKKVGLGMLEDPEYGPEFLIPLKMQGIQDITETSMIVRFKFTCLPGNPSILKREAMKRLIAACKEAGLEFASNAVTVRSNSTSVVEAAAASSSPPSLTSVAI